MKAYCRAEFKGARWDSPRGLILFELKRAVDGRLVWLSNVSKYSETEHYNLYSDLPFSELLKEPLAYPILKKTLLVDESGWQCEEDCQHVALQYDHSDIDELMSGEELYGSLTEGGAGTT